MRKSVLRFVVRFALACALCALLSLAVFAAEKTVYLSAKGGNDSASGNADAPFATLSAAIEAVKDGGRIVLTDCYTVKERDLVISNVPRFVEPEHAGKITMTARDDQTDYGESNGACLYFPEAYGYDCSGDLRFENIKMQSDGTAIYLAGNFHELQFGEGFECENTAGDAKKLLVIGGYHSPTSSDLPADQDVHITIDSGSFYRVISFSYQKGAATYTFTGTANVTINGGQIDRFYGGSAMNHYSGSLNLKVYGGTFSDIFLGGDITRALVGNAQVELYGGTVTSALHINNVLGNTDILLDTATVEKIEVSYGNDNLKAQAYGSRIALCYNSLLYSTEFINSIDGLTDTQCLGVLYVKSGATGSGKSESDPTGDLSSAVEELAKGGGDILILGTYAIGDLTLPAHAEPITLRGGTLQVDGNFVTGGEMIFNGVKLTGKGEISGSKLSVGAKTTADGALKLVGDSVSIEGGKFDCICGKDVRLVGGSVKRVELVGASLLVDGATVDGISLSAVPGADISLVSGKIGTLSVDSVEKFTFWLSGGNMDACILTNCTSSRLVFDDRADKALIEKLRPLFKTTESKKVVYVADGGKGNGTSADYAASSLADAYAALPTGGTIVVCGALTVDKISTPISNAAYTLTSVYGGVDYRETNGAQICFNGNLYLYAETVIDGVHIVSGNNSAYLVFNGYKGKIGSDVRCTLAPNVTNYVGIVAGTRHNNYALHNADLTINGGKWYHVYGASTAAANFQDMTVSLTINGGEFTGRVCAMGAGNQSGSGKLVINGGVFYGGVFGVAALATEVYNGSIDIVLNGGAFYGKIRVATRYETTVNGTYNVTVNGGDFSHLTDIVGGEAFVGELTSTITAGKNVNFGAVQSGSYTYTNPIRKAADPRIAIVDGMYYYMYTSSSTLSMYKAANIADLAYSVGEQIFDATKASKALDGRVHCIWPSKLEYFPSEAFGEEYAGWYLFFSTFSRELDGLGGTATDGQSRRSYVLKCTSNDLQGKWVNPVTGEEGVPERFCSDTYDWVNSVDWCAGETALRYNGKYYTLWIEQRDRNTEKFRQVMYLSEMKNPWTVTGKVLELVTPEYDWERGGYGYAENEKKWYPAVIEGITPIVGDNGELYVVYACSGYWTTEYKLGQMTYLGGDLLAASSWKKSPTPIFSKNAEVNGVGGPSICTTPDGKQRYILYHGYLGKDTSSGRYMFLEPYSVDGNGVRIGADGHPSPLNTTFTIPLNSMPLGFKISGFDNLGGTRVTLTVGKSVAAVNSAEKALDAVPVIRNNRTMLPVRFVAEAFGAKVDWDGTTSTATLTGADGRIVQITIGKTSATVNGKDVPLDSPAFIDPASGRTYLPVRAVAEALGASVFWNGDLSMAMLSK